MSDSITGEGGGRAFERVAGELRARMTDGTYPHQSLLPPQRELADEFDVSRDTVQRVLKELSNDGWIDTRQGRGSRVIWMQRVHSPTSSKSVDGMVTLRPIIEHAFEQPEVTLDVFSLTSESLEAYIRLQAERIRSQQITPRRIALRMLLPSESLPLPYWRTHVALENEALKERYLGLVKRYTVSMRSVLRNLETDGLVSSVSLDIRRVRLMPHIKLYLLNGSEAVLGPYKAKVRTIVLEDGREIEEALDVVGPAAGLTHHVKDEDPNSQGTVFVNTWQDWFDATWNHLTD
ncbi:MULTISPECIES: GntR family transcriptional regulator [unclassified Streptomyces]|uniref:GntR family transcriptional regulator n=1 Tax=unclassified Streptomyces TaxID=2593676 RepID=UPI002259EB4D|nr:MULTISPECIES: GntR family transcriptional regulator [unclassified Streptomyces]MCX5333157.1 GntR family transcriptional regulator [Streptomyces sp. NBC_00140]MCX5362575.1 GntR family transcriptional regulator [Streptomyces sp. NBC_00124]